MKKITSAVTGLLIAASLSTVSAAQPFEFVPAGHWSYASVNTLYEAGIFSEYKDVRFAQEQPQTRYDMAVLVAKAMANGKKLNETQQAAVEKLAAEYSTELENLGARPPKTVTTAQKGTGTADRIAVSGYFRLRYQMQHDDKASNNNYHSLYSRTQFDAAAKITDGWTANFTWEAYKSFFKDAGQPYGTMASAWGANGYNGVNDLTVANVCGTVGGTKVTIGKFGNSFGSGLMFDDRVSGIRLEFGKEVKTQLVYAEADSNVAGNTPMNSYLSKLSKVTAATFKYDASKTTRLTGSVQRWVSKTPGLDALQVYDLNVTTALSPTVSVYATYDKTSADHDNQAYVLGVSYKGANPNIPGSFGAFIDYEVFPQYTAIDTVYSLLLTGTKGVAAGFSYVPAKNIKFTNVIAYSKTMANNNLGPNGSAAPEGARQKFFRTQLFYYF